MAEHRLNWVLFQGNKMVIIIIIHHHLHLLASVERDDSLHERRNEMPGTLFFLASGCDGS